MCFFYKFQGSDGSTREGELNASSLDAAYSALRKSGVRPMKVWPKPGLMNRLSLGKRGLAIALLALSTVMLSAVALRRPPAAAPENNEVSPLPRCQVPAVAVSFDLPTERLLSVFARPGCEEGLDEIEKGVFLSGFREEIVSPVRVGVDDSPDVILLKRVVATLKDEARVALRSGETPERFVARLVERQRMEADYRRTILQRVRTGKLTRDAADASLQLMGLAKIAVNSDGDFF